MGRNLVSKCSHNAVSDTAVSDTAGPTKISCNSLTSLTKQNLPRLSKNYLSLIQDLVSLIQDLPRFNQNLEQKL